MPLEATIIFRYISLFVKFNFIIFGLPGSLAGKDIFKEVLAFYLYI